MKFWFLLTVLRTISFRSVCLAVSGFFSEPGGEKYWVTSSSLFSLSLDRDKKGCFFRVRFVFQGIVYLFAGIEVFAEFLFYTV